MCCLSQALLWLKQEPEETAGVRLDKTDHHLQTSTVYPAGVEPCDQTTTTTGGVFLLDQQPLNAKSFTYIGEKQVHFVVSHI